MPLNTDPDAIPDNEYWARHSAAVAEQEKAGHRACGDAPPADLVARIVADLDGDGIPG